MTAREDAIRAVLNRFHVRKHYQGTSRLGPARYAVFAEGVALTAPAAHADAIAERQDLIVHALLALMAGEPESLLRARATVTRICEDAERECLCDAPANDDHAPYCARSW